MPTARGTGFFVSVDGWFVTAAHVITENGKADGPVRQDIDQAWLTKEMIPGKAGTGMCQFVSFDIVDPETDFALLKVDFKSNSNKVHLVGRSGFPFITVSTRDLLEGEPVYSFGYPLSETLGLTQPNIAFSHTAHSPRTTSAIVAATMDKSEVVSWIGFPAVYVLDNALSYGNSGGPIVASETGKVHAFCSRFQPVAIPQQHLQDRLGFLPWIYVPSLYGVVSRLSNARIVDALTARGVFVSTT
jgi:serine protease Do